MRASFFVVVLALVAVCSAQGSSRPHPSLWRNDKDKYLDWLLTGCQDSDRTGPDCRMTDHPSEYEGYDGWYNNLARPSQGAVDTALLRLLPPAYSDGVYQPAIRAANPFTVSDRIMNGTNGRLSKGGKTAFLVFFGQQVVEEVLDAQRPGCPPEYFNIKVPEGHEYLTQSPHLNEMPLLRSRYDMNTGYAPNNPRQQLNEITPYLDGGLVYGVAKGWADVLRTFSNGSLAPHGQLAWHDELGRGFPAANSEPLPLANPPPPTNHTQYVHRQSTAPVNRFFKLGNPRGNENPFLLTFGIFFFRWHNKIALRLRHHNNEWSDERVFNEARKWVIATHQSVVLYDWLPKWLRDQPSRYTGYKPTVDPQISHVFQSAAMRFGHTLVTSGVYLRKKESEGCSTTPYHLVNPHSGADHSAGVRTCNSFWRSPELFKQEPANFERFLMGMSSQSTEREDHIIVDDLRGRVFGPLEFSRRDLMAVNIQRGRDHGLPDYNTARKHFNLSVLSSLDLSNYKAATHTLVEDQVLQELGRVYDSPDSVDIWAGGLLETTLGPGQLFSRIIKDQFERIRDGDRFWFENKINGQFRDDERSRIRMVRIIDLLLTVTDLTDEDIQQDPFTAVHANNKLTKCSNVLNTSTNCMLPFARSNNGTTCHYLPALGDSNLEACTEPQTYDHFTGSSVAYILTFIVVIAIALALFVTMGLLTRYKQSKKARFVATTKIKVSQTGVIAKERVSRVESRFVVVEFQAREKRINVQSVCGSLQRTVDLQNLDQVTVRHLTNYHHVVLQMAHHYDLYLKFPNEIQGRSLLTVLTNFFEATGITADYVTVNRCTILEGITTYADRAKELAEFSRLVLSKAFDESTSPSTVSSLMKLPGNARLLSMQITKSELSAELGTGPDTLFMQQLFRLMDKDGNGFILLQEFWDVMVLFAKGSPKEKAHLIFSIYDVSQRGALDEKDLSAVVESMLGAEGKGRDIDAVVANILASVNLSPGSVITFEKFFELFKDNQTLLTNINLQASGNSHLKGRKQRFSIYGLMTQDKQPSKQKPPIDRIDSVLRMQDAKVEEESEQQSSVLKWIQRYIYSHQVLLWWRTIYTIVMLLIFSERAYYYSVEREHSGLRRIAGYGVTVTRGAASAMMFTYSSLLVTMCRNILNQVRSSFLGPYFPVDYMVKLHRYIANWALLWTVVHIVGHCINFYHIATQTPSDLTCLFRDFFRQTHVLPKFQYWCWQTITGITGILLTLQCAIIYVFAYLARHYYFKLFWITHNTYPLFYLLIILHGSGNLVQEPFFHYFFLAPAILFALDKLMSTSVSTVKIDVLEAQHLPSNVTLLKIRRPPNFSYHAGQWIRIASLAISKQEYHPFTLSSAPHEEHLTLHIRAVGPWTTNLRKEYPDYASITNKDIYKYPKIYIDGPFGEGHQTWWDYELAILVGGGIGVTPFASILKHIAHCSNQPTFSNKTKRVMFLWVTSSQKQFEWLTEILHEVEEQDSRNLIRNHIFITQFKNKFDLRTIFLYLAERHFQRVSGTSLFTGLKAITHFSRPPFPEIFRAAREQYAFASRVGVFTCGSPSLSKGVERACQSVNQDDTDVIFKHYAENF